MDEMTMYEAKDIAKNVLYVDKNDRELQRYQLYVAIQSNSKKKYTPSDILSLPWDNVWLNKTEFTYNKEDDNRTEKMANNIANLLNEGKITFESTNLIKEENDRNIQANKQVQ